MELVELCEGISPLCFLVCRGAWLCVQAGLSTARPPVLLLLFFRFFLYIYVIATTNWMKMPLRLRRSPHRVSVYPPLATRASSGAYVSGGPICHALPLGLTVSPAGRLIWRGPGSCQSEGEYMSRSSHRARWNKRRSMSVGRWRRGGRGRRWKQPRPDRGGGGGASGPGLGRGRLAWVTKPSLSAGPGLHPQHLCADTRGTLLNTCIRLTTHNATAHRAFLLLHISDARPPTRHHTHTATMIAPSSAWVRVGLRRIPNASSRNTNIVATCALDRACLRLRLSNASRRYNSTNPEGAQGASGAARTIPGPSWLWLDPIVEPFRAYGRVQQRRPYMTQLVSSLIIYFIGDCVAQSITQPEPSAQQPEPAEDDADEKGWVQKWSDERDWARTGRALVIGGLSAIPSYKWFLWLSKSFNYQSKILSLSTKVRPLLLRILYSAC